VALFDVRSFDYHPRMTQAGPDVGDGSGPLLDIYTEPDADPDTLANLGPLRALAGEWEGEGVDQHPVVGGSEENAYVEHYKAEPTDPQTNGPQLLYGLRYHTRIVKPGEVETFHDQTGYWLWEPASRTVMLTLAIPRGQVALAHGRCDPDATAFEVVAAGSGPAYGIISSQFLDRYFRTTEFRMTVTANSDGTWSYYQNTRLVIPDRAEPFDHVDRNTLHRVSPPVRNPLMGAAGA
jgi:hypothetical protein